MVWLHSPIFILLFPLMIDENERLYEAYAR
jgi:hypothetical protein